jgi:hypothetical protein
MIMLKTSHSQTGSAHVVIIVIIVVGLLGALGFVAWKNFFAPKDNEPIVTEAVQTKDAECEADVIEKNGVFCSKEIGIKLKVPTIFEGKFKKVDNYEIFKGTVDYATSTSAGTSDVVYSAPITGTDAFTLTIAKEPLRSGYVDIGHSLQGTYFDMGTGLLSLTTSPIQSYDSATGVSTASGEYAVADTVPSFVVDGVRFFQGSLGDAGLRVETYFAVVNNNIVKIKLTNNGYMGDPADDPSTIDAEQVFSELDNAIKAIELIP